MKIIKYSFLLLIIINFASCKNGEEKFVKEWESVKTIIPHKDFLKLNPDHTFTFKGGACTSSYNSYGKWKIINDTIILNSSMPKECLFLIGFGNNSKIPEKGIIEPETTIKGCTPKNEKAFINFHNDKFYLKNDTLKYVTNHKVYLDIRNDFFIKK